MPELEATPRHAAPTLRVGIDAHAIGERKTGNERFIANLIPALRARCEHELFLYVTTEAGERALSSLADGRTHIRRVRPETPFLRVPVALPLHARRDRLDVLFVQYAAGPVLPCPVVPVIHDVAFWKHPEFFSRSDRAWMRRVIPATMRRAAAIVTVSRFSRDEIVGSFSLDPARITVAHEAADPVFSREPDVAAGVNPPFLLAIGNLQPRKNLPMLLRAFRGIVDGHPELRERLVIVGQPWHEADAITRAASDLVASGRVVFTGYLQDERIAALLREATAFAFPSRYEGFGLPVLEAMAAGCPAVVADIPVMREIAGEAAVLVDPADPDAWTSALADVASHPDRRRRLVAAGLEHAATFSWDATAEAILGALEGAARRSRD